MPHIMILLHLGGFRQDSITSGVNIVGWMTPSEMNTWKYGFTDRIWEPGTTPGSGGPWPGATVNNDEYSYFVEVELTTGDNAHRLGLVEIRYELSPS